MTKRMLHRKYEDKYGEIWEVIEIDYNGMPITLRRLSDGTLGLWAKGKGLYKEIK